MENKLTTQKATTAIEPAFEHTFKNENCKKLCIAIVKAYKKETEAQLTIAKNLTEIKNKNLFKEEGFDKFSTFCEQVIGLKSSQTARYMLAYKNCTDSKGALPEKLKEYSISAIAEIANKADSPEKAVELINKYGITPSTSVKQITEKLSTEPNASGRKQPTKKEVEPTDYKVAFATIKKSKVFDDRALFDNLPEKLLKDLLKAIGEIKIETTATENE